MKLSRYLGDRPFWRVTISLALPVAIQNVLTSSFQLVDTMMVSRLGDVTLSAVGMAGGGAVPKPGEISLANNGVLFLDELPEFAKSALEVLRQPLEDGQITISRAAGTRTYPGHIMLVCAMNPCRCGYYGQPGGKCTCTARSIRQYMSKVSGPLMDRIDIHVNVPAVDYDSLERRADEEPSSEILCRVTAARRLQAGKQADARI